jgi:hypothetical protein
MILYSFLLNVFRTSVTFIYHFEIISYFASYELTEFLWVESEFEF